MKYSYFPGCSLKATGRAYEESFLSLCKALDMEMEELENWNCCGATSFMSVEMGAAYALTIRNLAIAEKAGLDMVAPCGGCYGILLKADHYYKKYPTVHESAVKSLKTEGLEYKGTVRVRHPLDVLASDLPPRALRSKVKKPLKGLKVACYYGCRFVRPIAPFDDMHNPETMDLLLKTVGARIVDYTMKGKCCGGAMSGAMPNVAQEMTYLILRAAERAEADVVATACPLCQFNLEAYQDEIRAAHPDLKPIPVVYFTQLLGVALGLDATATALNRQIVPVEPILREKGILADEKKQPATAGV
ncbi:MAG: CoB--CoM heterodisulfide reductase iron-sulfur subunit B family protein [Fimbriimonas sp.]|nr:CoB--CoM heterodisulfide reductase iron-sulfur subunit B family protein [Fimbriimonas sp.]